MTSLEKKKVAQLKAMVKPIMDEYCGPYSKLKKKELVDFILKLDQSSSQTTLRNKTVVDLKKIAKQTKEEYCKPPYSKMKKQNMIKMIQQYSAKNSNNNPSVISQTMSDVISFITGKVHSRDSEVNNKITKKSKTNKINKTNKTKRTRNSSSNSHQSKKPKVGG